MSFNFCLCSFLKCSCPCCECPQHACSIPIFRRNTMAYHKILLVMPIFIVLAMGLKPSPSGETFRFYNFCPFEVWNTFWLWLSFLVLRVVMRCATDWNALDNPSLINCRGRYCVRSLVRIGLQSVAHETSPNLPASAGSGSVNCRSLMLQIVYLAASRRALRASS